MRHLRPVCSRCIYWVPESVGAQPVAGHCHRNPPGFYLNPATGVVVHKFPTTDHHQWCGEFDGDPAVLTEAVRRSIRDQA